MLLEQPSHFRVYVLPAAIGMRDQACREALAEDRSFERLDDQFRRHRAGNLPTDDLAR